MLLPLLRTCGRGLSTHGHAAAESRARHDGGTREAGRARERELLVRQSHCVFLLVLLIRDRVRDLLLLLLIVCV